MAVPGVKNAKPKKGVARKVKVAMNTEARIDLLAAIAELSQHYPDWRLGQLVANISGWADQDIWDAEDSQLLEACRAHLEQLKTREKEVHA
jgi:hypothetical protein